MYYIYMYHIYIYYMCVYIYVCIMYIYIYIYVLYIYENKCMEFSKNWSAVLQNGCFIMEHPFI